MATLAVTSCVLLLSVLVLVVRHRDATLRRSLPPGPEPGFFGNKIPQPYAWRWFERLTEEFGPLVTVWIGRNPVVIVGTYAAAQEIMEKQSGATSDRPLTALAGEIMSGGKRILLVKYGERWRRLRKVMHQGLQPKSAASYEPIQEAAARTMIRDILSDPDDFQTHAKTYAASVIMTVTYGKTTPTRYADADVVAVNECGHRLGKALIPGQLLDTYPFLCYLPTSAKKAAQEAHRIELALFSKQLQGVRDGMKRGDGIDCFGRYLIEHQAAPTFTDQADLPLVQAFIKEVFRWRPVSSGGFAHATTAPVVYQNHVIPAGCQIIGNHWSISRDPAVFPDPDEFRPERWLVDGLVERGLRTDINHVGFGFGRRICAGKNLADRSLFINCSLLLWAFDFALKQDSHGANIPIDTLAFTNTANSHPLPFKTAITPRPGVSKIFEGLLDA
ncbi:hypothetical protein RQP46_000925 [Phenoliferia psychrophenolica]